MRGVAYRGCQSPGRRGGWPGWRLSGPEWGGRASVCAHACVCVCACVGEVAVMGDWLLKGVDLIDESVKDKEVRTFASEKGLTDIETERMNENPVVRD